MNTEYRNNQLYNSIYCLLPDGRISGRYDKHIPLDFIEKPVGNLIVPFYGNNSTVKKGDKQEPLATPYGKAGVMICNESFIPETASKMVKNGAEFLINSSNDG